MSKHTELLRCRGDCRWKMIRSWLFHHVLFTHAFQLKGFVAHDLFRHTSFKFDLGVLRRFPALKYQLLPSLFSYLPSLVRTILRYLSSHLESESPLRMTLSCSLLYLVCLVQSFVIHSGFLWKAILGSMMLILLLFDLNPSMVLQRADDTRHFNQFWGCKEQSTKRWLHLMCPYRTGLYAKKSCVRKTLWKKSNVIINLQRCATWWEAGCFHVIHFYVNLHQPFRHVYFLDRFRCVQKNCNLEQQVQTGKYSKEHYLI